jgi:hypothetical protein
MDFIFTTCSSLCHKGVVVGIFFPPSAHDLLPFHHNLFIICVVLHTTCVFICLSFFFCLHTHTHKFFNNFDISYHIHRVCFPKVHVVMPLMSIPKYLVFFSYMRRGLSHSCMVICLLSPCFFFCVCRVLDWDVLLKKRNLLEVRVENKSSCFILEFLKIQWLSGGCTRKKHANNQSM